MGVRVGAFYRHYKGTVYVVVGFARHSETQDDLVLYRAPGSDRTWARPIGMFCETVDREGATVPRFAPVEGGD